MGITRLGTGRGALSCSNGVRGKTALALPFGRLTVFESVRDVTWSHTVTRDAKESAYAYPESSSKPY